MDRPITGYHQDEDGHWVAALSCGHQQHVRHDPPQIERPWVLSAEGRAGMLGEPLACAACDRLEMPDGHTPVSKTPTFTADMIPPAFRREHHTKAGTWGRITVLEGTLMYAVPPLGQTFTLTPDAPGVIAPEVVHHVTASGPVQFYVTFFEKAPA